MNKFIVVVLFFLPLTAWAGFPGQIDPVCYAKPDRVEKASNGNYFFSVPVTAEECTIKSGTFYRVHVLHVDKATPSFIAEWVHKFPDRDTAKSYIDRFNARNKDTFKSASIEEVSY